MSDEHVIYSTSKEYVPVPVTFRSEGVFVDPTDDVVEMAFVPFDVAEPSSSDWNTASWETAAGVYLARCLVGPAGAVQLDAGRYRIFIRVSDNPEIPVKVSPTILRVI